MNDRSAGAVIYRNRKEDLQYLVLLSRTNDWEFPKGGIEGNEELQQTALREVEEETGITQKKIIDGFSENYDYRFRRNGKSIYKEVTLFIMKAFDSNVNLSEEHSDFQWGSYDEVRKTLSHEGPKRILDKAHIFIESRAE